MIEDLQRRTTIAAGDALEELGRARDIVAGVREALHLIEDRIGAVERGLFALVVEINRGPQP